MNRGHWVETVGAIALLVFAFLIVQPYRRARRVARNEEEALHLLCAIGESENLRRIAGDDQDAEGTYGFLADLLGDGLENAGPLDDVTSVAWPEGIFELDRSGYLFSVFLSDRGAGGIREESGRSPEFDGGRSTWCGYAWPIRFRQTGRRAFFLDASGRILQTENLGVPYEGSHNIPSWDAAYRDPSQGMTGRIVEDVEHGADGRIWEEINEEGVPVRDRDW